MTVVRKQKKRMIVLIWLYIGFEVVKLVSKAPEKTKKVRKRKKGTKVDAYFVIVLVGIVYKQYNKKKV